MDLQNSSQENMLYNTPPKSRNLGIILGIFVGIIQPIAMYFIMFTGGVSIFTSTSIFSILFVFLPLILEVIFWRKKYPYFVRGVTIGTMLLPLIGLGYCFLSLR